MRTNTKGRYQNTMQQLTYINLRGERLTFGRGGPCLLRSVRGLGACDNALTLTDGGVRDGGRLLALRREEREITASIQLLGTSRRDLYESRLTLCRLLSPDLAVDGESRARLVYENDRGSWWTWAVPEGGVDWGARAGDVHTGVSVRFRCESPFFYGSEAREAVFRQTRAGFRLPVRLPLSLGGQAFHMRVTNAGSAFAPCVITVEGSGETPALVNHSTGAALTMVSPLPYGERLTVSTDPSALAVSLTRADGREENAFGYLDPLSSVAAFGLRPGENDIEYVPGGDRSRSVIRIRWYDTFEGV